MVHSAYVTTTVSKVSALNSSVSADRPTSSTDRPARVARFRADHAAQNCDLCLVVGTSGLVYPAAALPGLAKEHGARVLLVNPQPSALDATADLVLPAAAGECLPALWPQDAA